MTSNYGLREVVENSFGSQKVLFYTMGVVFVLIGFGLMYLALTIEPDPDEEGVTLIMIGVSLFFILFAVGSIWYTNRRMRRILALLFETPEEIAAIHPYEARTEDAGKVHGIRIYTRQNKMLGWIVNGASKQRMLLGRLAELLPDVRVEQT